ncbi:chemotaxis protein CheB [Chitinimonas sp.]|uniref:chemotaxis protein CheB n=1 Tax=Chitinimonas sp. TaxID=1934313 RepID=UPI002F92F808
MHVLLIDDSIVIRKLLRAILESDGFRVSEASSGEEALAMLPAVQPDLISMDVHMPGIDGFETTRRIMQVRPTPIVIVTAGIDLSGAETAMQALSAGALMVLDKPISPMDPSFQSRTDILLSTFRHLAFMKVSPPGMSNGEGEQLPYQALAPWRERGQKVLAIGASAGGPAALKTILAQLRPDCPWPVLLVQHISSGFASSFCAWLAEQTSLPVRLAVNGQAAQPGHLHVAPDDHHLGLDGYGQIQLDTSQASVFARPSVDYLFDSLASALRGQVLAVLLSGMGRDGAQGLAKLKTLGALTLVQQPASSIVAGMPQAAIELNGASFIQTPLGIARTINNMM